MIWSSVQRFGTMIIAFVANIVLARLLTPEDFGIIGMIMVFIAISGIFVEGGLASALIQKKRPSNDDYSTVFYWNLIISTLFLTALYFAAPSIERFYEMPGLALYFRVVSLVLIINAFKIIQSTQLKKKLDFKKLANIYISATTIGAIVGIWMAYTGYGVWSLVGKMIALSFFQSLFLWVSSDWRPSFVFSNKSFRELFGFGSFMLLTSLLNKVYKNIQDLIIGKVFSAEILGYFTQARKLEEIPVQGLSAVVNQVTFPVFSELQDDIVKLKRGISESLKAITYVNFPMMVLLFILAEPIVLFLLTEKWSQSIPYLQVLSVAGMIYTLNTANTNIFKSLGKSDTYFYVTLTKRVVGIIFIIIGAQFGVMEMLYAIVINTYIFFFVNAYYSQKLTEYSILDQIKDVFPSYVLSILTGVIVFKSFNIFVISSNFMIIISQGILYSVIYLTVSYLLKLKAFKIYQRIIIKRLPT